MSQQLLQLLTLVLTVAGTVITTLYGYKATGKKVEEKVLSAVNSLRKEVSQDFAKLNEILRNKVDAPVHSAQIKMLEEKNVEFEKKQSALEAEVRTLGELVRSVFKGTKKG